MVVALLVAPSLANCPFMHGGGGQAGRQPATREEIAAVQERLQQLLLEAKVALAGWLVAPDATGASQVAHAVHRACNDADTLLQRHRLPHSPNKSANLKLQTVGCLRLGLAMVEWEGGADRQRVKNLLGVVKKNAREIDPDYDGLLTFAPLLSRAADAFASHEHA